MTDRFSITLTSSIDSGEGWATPKNKEKLDSMIHDFGGLWCEDVIGDWRSILEVQHDRARVADRAHDTHHNACHVMSPEQFLEYVWKLGWNNPEGIAGLAELYFDHSSAKVPYDFVMAVEAIVEDEEQFAAFKERVLAKRVAEIVDTVFEQYNDEGGDETKTVTRTTYKSRIHLGVAHEIIRRLGGIPEKKEIA